MADIPKNLMPDIRAFEVPRLREPDLRIPPNPLIVAAQANYASEFHKRLVKWINDFDAELDQAYEVGVRLVTSVRPLCSVSAISASGIPR